MDFDRDEQKRRIADAMEHSFVATIKYSVFPYFEHLTVIGYFFTILLGAPLFMFAALLRSSANTEYSTAYYFLVGICVRAALWYLLPSFMIALDFIATPIIGIYSLYSIDRNAMRAASADSCADWAGVWNNMVKRTMLLHDI